MPQAGTLSRSGFVAAIVVGILLIVGAFVFWSTMISKANEAGGIYIPGLLPWLLVAVGISISSWGIRGLSRLGHATVTKKVKIASAEVRVYQEPDSRSPLVVRLVRGADVKVGETKTVNGLPWVTVHLPNKQGYVLADTCQVFAVVTARILETAFIYADRESHDAPIARLDAGSEVEIYETEWDQAAGDAVWADTRVKVSVWLADGRQGFMPRKTKVQWVESAPTT